MEYIKEIVLNIVVCIILINIVNMITVSSRIKKYIRLFCGFILIMVIISPVKNVLKNMEGIFNINSLGKMSKDVFMEYDKTTKSINRIEEMMDEKNIVYIKNQIENTYESVEKAIVKIKKIGVDITKVVIRLKTNDKVDENRRKSLELDIKNMVCNYFNIVEEQVEIRSY